MNTMNMPGFTAESALSITGRGYRLPRVGRSTAAPGVRPALMNVGGGGSGFWRELVAGLLANAAVLHQSTVLQPVLPL